MADTLRRTSPIVGPEPASPLDPLVQRGHPSANGLHTIAFDFDGPTPSSAAGAGLLRFDPLAAPRMDLRFALVDDVAEFFEKGRKDGKVVTPGPGVHTKKALLADRKWKKKVQDMFDKHGEPTAAETEELKSCKIMPSEWMKKALRRARKVLVDAVKAAMNAEDSAPVGSQADDDARADTTARALRALADFDNEVTPIVKGTVLIEQKMGAAPDSR